LWVLKVQTEARSTGLRVSSPKLLLNIRKSLESHYLGKGFHLKFSYFIRHNNISWTLRDPPTTPPSQNLGSRSPNFRIDDIYIYMYIYVCIYICIYMYIYVYIYIYIMRVCVCVCACVCVCVCVFTY